MAKKPNIGNLASGFRSSNKLNSDFQDIKDAFENTLSRDGSGPNEMLATLDMNSQRIVNLSKPVNPTDAARLMDANGISDEVMAEIIDTATEAAEIAGAEAVGAVVDDLAEKTLSNVTGEDFSNKAFSAPIIAGTSRPPRTIGDRLKDNLTIYAVDYGVIPNDFSALVALANTQIINKLMAYLGSQKGGRLVLPRGSIYTLGALDNKYSGVLVEGYMSSRFHDAGSPVFGTTIVPMSAEAALKHRTPYASELGVAASTLSKNTGGGFINMRVIGNGIAPRLLEVGAVSSAQYDLYLENAVGDAAAYFLPGISGTDLGEACDIQSCRIRLNVRQLDGTPEQAAHCVYFGASVNANVSLNFDVRIFAQHYNGHALFMQGADNNSLYVTATRAGGTGKTVQGGDPANYNPNIGGNTFKQLSGNGGCHLLGTDTPGGIANFNVVLNYDNGNGSPVMTAGTGSRWIKLADTFGTTSGLAHERIAVSDSAAGAMSARNAMGSETLRISNGSNNHVVLDNGTQQWSLNLDPTTGNVRFVRLSGSGKFQVTGDVVAADADFASINAANGLNIKVSNVIESQIYRGSAGEIAVKTNANNPGSECYFSFRPDGDLSILMGGLMVGGNRVVGNRGAAVANATDAASAITQLNALLARMRAHGLIAT